MGREYTRVTLADRVAIQECLDKGCSINACAKTIGRAASTVLREVRENRMRVEGAAHKYKCGQRSCCTLRRVCGDGCPSAETDLLCKDCKTRDCRDACSDYIERARCDILSRAPYVCNRCKRKGYRCGRDGKFVYEAKAADAMARTRRSDARRGIDLDEERAEEALSLIKQGLARGLSPYEISVLYESELGVHRSTIYRWVEAGYGGLSNMELERKVGFRPRRKDPLRKVTSHSRRRAYAAFEGLPEDIRASAVEMDTVIGRNSDVSALLTLYHRPSDLQLALLLEEKTCEEVKRALLMLKGVCAPSLFDRLFRCVLTDNGIEFSDEDGLGAIFGEKASRRSEPRLLYCDVRASQQKGSCEKNHSELRQILRKGLFSFDELEKTDLSVVMSHANSNPREGLCGMSPIGMFLAAYGDDGRDFLDALGIRQMARNEIVLTPDVLDTERIARGKEPLTRLQ